MASLRELLAAAWEKAGRTTRASVSLPSGLAVVIRRKDGVATLSCGRTGKLPGDTEVATILRETPVLVPRSAQVKHERRNGYEIIAYTWSENGATKPVNQPLLGLALPEPPEDENPDLDTQFARFHAANPHVFQTLRDMALEEARAGRRRIGTKRLIEDLRSMPGTTTGDEYKLNNSYTSRYARLLKQEPELANLIETRELRS